MKLEYKSLFIESTFLKNSMWESAKNVNGDDLARNVQAALLEMSLQNYELKTSTAIITSTTTSGTMAQSYTQGILLIFQKNIEA